MKNTKSSIFNLKIVSIVLIIIAGLLVGFLAYEALTKNDESNIVVNENIPIPETKDGSNLPAVDPSEDKTGEILPPQESNPGVNNQADITEDDLNFQVAKF